MEHNGRGIHGPDRKHLEMTTWGEGGGEEEIGDENNISLCVLKLPVNCDTFLDNCNSCVDTGAVHR